MANRLSEVLRRVRQVLSPAGDALADGQLLGRFLAARDEAAFAALVRRHGPMVLGVCRRILRHAQDAEDAFQATFLVLARKAGAVRRPEAVGSWLYGVAYRTALEARAAAGRRQSREKQVAQMPDVAVLPAEPQDWRPLLDRELSRLPERYRRVLVLCDLEARPRREAAAALGLPVGTLFSRLVRGRELLARRLRKYGLSLPVAAFASALAGGASAAVPAPLVSSTAKSAVLVAAGQLAALATPAASLTTGVLKAMFLSKLKMAGAVLAAALIVTGTGTFAYRSAGGEPGGTPAASAGAAADGTPAQPLDALRAKLKAAKDRAAAAKAEAEVARAAALEADAAVALVEEQLRMREKDRKPADLVEENRRLRDRIRQLEAQVNKRLYADTIRQAEAEMNKIASDLSGQIEKQQLEEGMKEAEAALKALREARDREGRRRATEALEKAVKKLRTANPVPETFGR